MADEGIEKRLRYFDGQFLQARDFIDEQKYHLDRQRRANRSFHRPGVTEGLTVRAPTQGTTVTVDSGTAMDAQGRFIFLRSDRDVEVTPPVDGKPVILWAVISYDEKEADKAQVGLGENTRWLEEPRVALITSNQFAVETDIKLGEVSISGDGKVQSSSETGRQGAGVKITGDLEVTQLILKSDAAVSPSLRPGDNNIVEVQGGLSVGGTLKVPAIALLEAQSDFPVGRPTPLPVAFKQKARSDFPLLHVEARAITPPDAEFYWLVGRSKGTSTVFFHVTNAGNVSSVKIDYHIYELDVEVVKPK